MPLDMAGDESDRYSGVGVTVPAPLPMLLPDIVPVMLELGIDELDMPELDMVEPDMPELERPDPE